MMSEDLIRREDVMLRVREFIGNQSYDELMLVNDLNALPSVKQPERTANVIRRRYEFTVKDNFFHAFGGTELLCENCKKKVLAGDDYCSHCGAKLIWGDENDK